MSKIKILPLLILFAVAGIIPNAQIFAQEHEETGLHSGKGYFMFGWNKLNIGNLNAQLAAKGYSQLSDNLFSFGGGGFGIINNFLLGGEGHGLYGTTVASGNYNLSLTAGYGFFDLGYIVFSSESVSIFPIIGIGGGGITLDITNRNALTFDEILDEPGRMSKLSAGGFLMNFSIGADYIIDMGNNDNESNGGLAVGIIAGYTFAPMKGQWQMNQVTVSGGPEVGVDGFYIRLMIGGGGMKKTNE